MRPTELTLQEECDRFFAGNRPAPRFVGSLFAAYRAPERYFHNLLHLAEMSAILHRFREKLTSFPACFMACLCHDVVYVPGAPDNEERSAEYCREEMARLGFTPEQIGIATALIISTKRHIPLLDTYDNLLFLDADLAILGDERSRYQDYLNAVRREYYIVEEKAYVAGRSAVLREFLGRERLYLTDELHALRDEAARANIAYELEVLSRPHALAGTFSRTAGGFLSYEIFNAIPDIIREIGDILTVSFGCTGFTPPVAGADQVIGECSCGETRLCWGWDNWSGFYIFSDSAEGDRLVALLGEAVNRVLHEPRFRKYVQYW